MKHPRRRKGSKPFLPGALLIRNALDLNFANRALKRRRLARLLASYRKGWGWMGDWERREHLSELIGILRIWKPVRSSSLASWLRHAMIEFHLLQVTIFKLRTRVTRKDALRLAEHWFSSSVSPVFQGF